MARLITCGYEFQTIDTVAAGRAEGENYLNVGAPTIDTSVARSGAACLKVGTNAHYAAWSFTGQLDHWIYARAYIRFDGNSTTSANCFGLVAGASFVGHIFLVQQGSGTAPKMRLRNSASTAVGSDTATLVTNTWYRVELGAFVPTAGSGKLYFWLDDVLIASSDSTSTGNSAVTSVRTGLQQNPGNGVSVYYDDVAINDDTGGSQNSRPGEGRIVLRKPTSGSASGFTGGAGGAAAATAVDNLPPVGVASDSATDSSQIKSGISNTTDNYEATLEAYTASEIASSDLVTVIQAVANVGDDTAGVQVTAGASVTDNPADNNEGTAATATAASGTYPTDWQTVRGPVIYSPSVTLGSASKVKVRRTTSTIAALHVDFIGLYVEYQRRLTASISDSVTPSESVGKAPHSNLADSTAPTDAEAATTGKAETDSVTPTDAQTAAVGQGQADTVTASDAMSAADTVALGDSVTLTDQIYPDIPEVFTESFVESVLLLDSVAAVVSSTSGTAAPPEPVGLVAIQKVREGTHTLLLSESVLAWDGHLEELGLSDFKRFQELAALLR